MGSRHLGRIYSANARDALGLPPAYDWRQSQASEEQSGLESDQSGDVSSDHQDGQEEVFRRDFPSSEGS
jgi:hypothetical protein